MASSAEDSAAHGQARKQRPFGFTLLVTTLVVSASLRVADAFRVADPAAGPPAAPAQFAPYDPGFVGRTADPNTPRRYRVNPGAPGLSLAQPNIFRAVLPRQDCPSMVGPFDGVYHCTSSDAGYCDRRSGVCFCYSGYMGKDCSVCRPTHFQDANGTCVPRKLCPNDCSGAGECDAETGRCRCFPGRRGVDCSLQHCRVLDRWCRSCSDAACTDCEQGYFLSRDGTQCLPCTLHDPRCLECNADGCSTCSDPLLNSVRRSGRRRIDPPLPWDEDARILARPLPVGTQDAAAFEEAEPYALITDAAAYPTHGIARTLLSPADACRSVLGVGPDGVGKAGKQGRVTMALLQGTDMMSSGGNGIPRRYSIDCSPLAYQDSWYGFGPAGAALEGPVEGALYGSRLSPAVYAPGGITADDGSSLVDIIASLPNPSRVLNNSIVEILLGLEAALANDTSTRAALFKRWNNVSNVLAQLVSGAGLNATRWSDYEGYRIDSIDPVLNTNSTYRNFTAGFALPTQHYTRRQLETALQGLGLHRQLFDATARSLPSNSPSNGLNVTLAFPSGLSTGLPAMTFPLLNASALACEQGRSSDDTWQCSPVRESHVVCGTPGTLRFSSPTYAVLESDGFVRVTVQRSGGGLGRVTAQLSLQHVTTDDADVSFAAQQGTSQLLVFEPGVVSLTVRLTIHDDRAPEPEGWPAHFAFVPSTSARITPSRSAAVTSRKLQTGAGAGPAAYGMVGDGTALSSSEWAALSSLAAGLDGQPSIPVGRLRQYSWSSVATELDNATEAVAAMAGTVHVFPAPYSTASAHASTWPGDGSLQWHARLGPHETFMLRLSEPTGSASLGPVTSAQVAIIDDDGYNVHPASSQATGPVLLPVPAPVVQDAVQRLSGGASLVDAVAAAASAAGGAGVSFAQAGVPTVLTVWPTDARGTAVNATRLTAHVFDAVNAPDVTAASIVGSEQFIVLLEQIQREELDAALGDARLLESVGDGSALLATGSAATSSAVPAGVDDDDEDDPSAATAPVVQPVTSAMVDRVLSLLRQAPERLPSSTAHESYVTSYSSANGTYYMAMTPAVAGLVRTSVLHAMPGGLRAEYYDSMELSGKPLLSRVEQQVDHTWGLGPLLKLAACADGRHHTPDFAVPGTLIPSRASDRPSCRVGHYGPHTSVRWSGRIRAERGQAGLYRLTIQAAGAARVWVDGRLVMHLLDAPQGTSEPPATSGPSLRPSAIQMLNTTAPKTVCTYVRTDGSSADADPAATTSINLPGVDVLCVQADSAAALDGSTSAGFASSRARDRLWGLAGQQRPDMASYAMDSLWAVSQQWGASRTAYADVRLTDTRTHAVVVEYVHEAGWASAKLGWVTPTMAAAGITSPVVVPARCLYSTRHVGGSPTLTYIRPGKPWAVGQVLSVGTPAVSNTRIVSTVLAAFWGTGSSGYAAANQLSPGTVGGDSGQAGPVATSMFGQATSSAVATVANRFYIASRDAYGNARGLEALDDAQASRLHAQATLVHPQAEVALGQTALTRPCTTGNDPGAGPAYGLSLNLQPRAVLPTVSAAWISGTDRVVSPVQLGYESSSGLVTCTYSPAAAGQYALSTVVWADWNVYRHATGSPSVVTVRAGAVDATVSTVDGYGVAPDGGNAVAGSPFVAVIQLRDSAGNVMTLEEDEWCPEGVCISNGQRPAVAVVSGLSSGSGTPATDRLARLRVRLQALPLAATPSSPHGLLDARITALALPVDGYFGSPAWDNTLIDVGNGVRIPVRSIATPAMYASAPVGSTTSGLRMLVYVATWTPLVACEYRISVTLASSGSHIAASPYPQVVVPGPAHGFASTLSNPVRYAASALPALFTFTVRDAYGNARVYQNKSWSVTVPNRATSTAGSSLAVDPTTAVGGPRQITVQANFSGDLTVPSADGVQAMVNWTAYTALGPVQRYAACTVVYFSRARYNLTCPCGGLVCGLTPSVRGSPMAGSPYIYYRPGNDQAVSGSTTNAWGPGVFAPLAGQASFMVQLRDINATVLAGPVTDANASNTWAYPAGGSTRLGLIASSLTLPANFVLSRLGGVRPDGVEGTASWLNAAGLALANSDAVLPYASASYGYSTSSGAVTTLPRWSPLSPADMVTASQAGPQDRPGPYPGAAPRSVAIGSVSPVVKLASLPTSWALGPSSLTVPNVGTHVVSLVLPTGLGAAGLPLSYTFNASGGDADDAWSQAWPPSTYSAATAYSVPASDVAPTAQVVSGSPGLVLVQYYALRSGVYLLDTALPLGGTGAGARQSLLGFPLVVAVLPGPAEPAMTEVVGPAVDKSTAGVATAVAIIPRDQYGNRVGRVGAERHMWAVEVAGAGRAGSTILPEPFAAPPVPGTFTASWTPRTAGVHRLSVYKVGEPGQVQAEYWPGSNTGRSWGDIRGPGASPDEPTPSFTRTETSIGLDTTMTDGTAAAAVAAGGVTGLLYGGPGWRVRWSALLRLPQGGSALRNTTLLEPLTPSASASSYDLTSSVDVFGPSAADKSASLVEEVLVTVKAVGGDAELWVSSADDAVWRVTPSALSSTFGTAGQQPLVRRVLFVPQGTTRSATVTIRRGWYHGLVITYQEGGQGLEDGSSTMPGMTTRDGRQECSLDVSLASPTVAAITGVDSASTAVPIGDLAMLLYQPVARPASTSPMSIPVSPGPGNGSASTVVVPAQPGVDQDLLKTSAGTLSLADVPHAIVAATRVATISVSVRDANGNPRVLGAVHPHLPALQTDTITAWAVVEDTAGVRSFLPPTEFTVTYDGFGGQYSVQFTPAAAGVYRLYLALNGPTGLLSAGMGPQALALAASKAGLLIGPGGAQEPWLVAVAPSVVADDLTSKTYATGYGLVTSTAGVPDSFLLHVLDSDGNYAPTADVSVSVSWSRAVPGQLMDGDRPWDVSILPTPIPGVVPIPVPSLATKGSPAAVLEKTSTAGLYRVRYTPLIAGSYAVTVRVGGVPTAQSPYTMTVRPAAAAATASSIELSATAVVLSPDNRRLTYNSGLFSYGLNDPTPDQLALGMVRTANGSAIEVLGPLQQLDAAGIQSTAVVALPVGGTYQVPGTGSVVPVPPAPLPPAVSALVPSTAAGMAARGRLVLEISTSTPTVPSSAISSVSALRTRLNMTSPNSTMGLDVVLALQGLAAAYPKGLEELAAVWLTENPAVLGKIVGAQVRLRDAAGAPLSVPQGNVLYVSLVKERLFGADASGTWSPWGPVEAPIAGSSLAAGSSFMPAVPGIDTVGAAGALPTAMSVRGWASSAPPSPLVQLDVALPVPSTFYRMEGQDAPSFRSAGRVTAPVTLPRSLLGKSASELQARTTVKGSWRLHVLLLHPSMSEGYPRLPSHYGLTGRFWRSRMAWLAGEAPAHSEVVTSNTAVSFGPPAANATGSALWTRKAVIGSSLAIFTGFLVPPVSAGFRFRVACDGPCSVDLEGLQRIGWNGTHATAGSIDASETRPGLTALISGGYAGAAALPLQATQPYALRLTLQQSPGHSAASPASLGQLKLEWSWSAADWEKDFDGTILDNGVARQQDQWTTVPPEALYWAAEPVLGSPAPVCVESC